MGETNDRTKVELPRFHKLLFSVSLVVLSWYGMMAVHEFGHVIGAILTGSTITQVVLHPLSISRTDVSPNPHPLVVVWLGPIVGSVVPLVLSQMMPKGNVSLRNIAQFFAGFCLIANGAYISIGSFDRVGDCDVMLRTGTPHWTMIAFGVFTVPLGLFLWHQCGSLKDFISNPSFVPLKLVYYVFGSLVVLVVAGFLFSSR